MKYLSTSNLITIVPDKGESISLASNNPYFSTIKDLLDNNQDWGEEISSAISNTRSKRLDNIGYEFSNSGGVTYYKGRILSPSFQRLVTQYLDEDIPLTPLSNLLDNLSDIKDVYAMEMMEQVSLGLLPITYTGNIIGYKRQSWIDKDFNNLSSYEQFRRAMFRKVCEPGEYVEYENGLTVGTLEWAGKFCSDQGALQEVVIEPRDMLNVKSFTQDKPFLVKRYMFLGNILEKDKKEERDKLVFIMQTNQLGSGVVVRKPYSPDTIREYLNTLLNRTIDVNTPLPIGNEIEAKFEGVKVCN